MKKVKKGSTLVMVLIIFSVLSILGMAISSLALSGFKVRTLKANVNKNLYASEAGIDEAYGIIGKAVDEAIIGGNDAAKEFIDNLDLAAEVSLEIAKNEAFENGIPGHPGSPYINDDLSIDEEAIRRKQNELFRQEYVETLLGEGDISSKNNGDTEVILKLNDSSLYEFKSNANKAPVIAANLLNNVNLVHYDSEEEEKLLTIRISSTFQYNEIEKSLNADYDIYVPKHEDTYYLETDYIEVPQNIVWTKGLVAGGNITINSRANINGDVFAGRNIDIKANRNTGENDSNILLGSGNISAAENFLLSSNAICGIAGNLLANNVIIKKEEGNNSKLIVNGAVYTKDDLEIDGFNSEVAINNGYYGISDGRQSLTSDSSSSININALDLDGSINCRLQIAGESLIMGSSYINVVDLLGNKYQTGESISVKGNYKAYTYPLTTEGIFNEEKVRFIEYTIPNNPDLSISFVSKYFDFEELEADGSPKEKSMNVVNKSQYFKLYSEEYEAYEGLNWDNIATNDNFIHIGAAIDGEGRVTESNYIPSDNDLWEAKQKEFGRVVYNMGEELVDDNIINSPVKTVSNQISVNKNVEFDDTRGVVFIKTGDYTLTNSDSPSTVVGNSMTISNSNSKGIIIVDGNITISGNFNFQGTIIATGNINILGNEEKTITYNADVVKSLVELRWDIFKSISNSDMEPYYIQRDPSISVDTDIKSTIKKDKLIKISNWTILK